MLAREQAALSENDLQESRSVDPLGRAGPPREPGTEPAPHLLTAPARILIIEDGVDAAQTLAEVLSLDGHEVDIANDGATGIERALVFAPDVVVCDVGLPGIDGYEVARVLREDPCHDDALLIALTGYATTEDVAHAKASGFDEHLAKPPDLDRLTALIARRRRAH